MRAWIVTMVVMGSQAACGPAIHGVVRDTIDEAARPDNWGKLREPARVLASEVSRGVLEAGLTPELRHTIDQALDEYVHTFIAAAADESSRVLPRSLEPIVRASVRTAIEELLDGRVIQSLDEVTRRIAFAASSGLLRGVAHELHDELGHALARFMTGDLGPALAATLEHDLGPALETAARRSSAAAAEGFIDGVARRIDPVLDGVAARLDATLSAAQHGASSAAELILIAILGMAVALLAAGAAGLAMKARNRHAALRLVAREMSAMSTHPAIHELHQRMSQAGSGSRGGDCLEAHLRRHPELRAGKLESPA